jgi:hypothetical protein
VLLQFKADAQVNASRQELLKWERQIVHYLHKFVVNTMPN